MIAASELAGMFAAHAVWTISTGDFLNPMLVFTDQDGARTLEKLEIEPVDEAVGYGRKKIATNEMKAAAAALLFEGQLELDRESLDAIIVELKDFSAPDAQAVYAIPYSSVADGPFKIYSMKVLMWEECDKFTFDDAIDSFFAGVSGHEQGSEVWEKCLDESV